MDDIRIIPHPIAQAVAEAVETLTTAAEIARIDADELRQTGQHDPADVATEVVRIAVRLAHAVPHLQHIPDTPPRRLFGCLYLPEPVHAWICTLPPKDRHPVNGLPNTTQCDCGCYVREVGQ